jgi:hypothetical protein
MHLMAGIHVVRLDVDELEEATGRIPSSSKSRMM